MSTEEFFIVLLAILSTASLVRLLKGPTIWDRLLGFALFSSKVIILAILMGFMIEQTYMVDIAIIYGVLGFIGTIMIARFVERRGDI